MIEFYYRKGRVFDIEDLQTKVCFSVIVDGKLIKLTFSDIALAKCLGVYTEEKREIFIKMLTHRFSAKTKRLPNTKLILPIPEEWKQNVQKALQFLISTRQLFIVDSNYIRAFNNPLYEQVFLKALQDYFQKSKLPLSLGIQDLLNNPSQLFQVVEPEDSDFDTLTQ